jgi:hypothetical protein
MKIPNKAWTAWDPENPPNGLVLVMFMNSKIFPKGAIVQADACEVLIGVIGDTKPDYYMNIEHSALEEGDY